MSKPITTSSHHLTKITLSVLAALALLAGLGWLLARPAYAQGPVVNIGDLPPGKVVTITFRAAITNPLPAGVAQVCNQGQVSGGNFATFNTNDPTTGAPGDPTCTTVPAAPDLVIAKSDGGVTVTPGDTINYSLSYSNTGNQNATGVVLTETVPANTTFSGSGWTCVPNNNAGSTCTRSVGGLAAGGSGSAPFAVTVVNPVPAGVTQISNTASIGDGGANGADPTPANNSDTDTTPLTAAPDLLLTKSDGGVTATPGGNIAYTLSYTNSGNQGATGVTLTETVPANTTFSGSGWSCTPNNNAGSTCTQTVGGLAGGGSNGSVPFVVTVINPVSAGVTQISNTASLGDDGANGADPTPANNSDSDTTPLTAEPDMRLTKSDGGITATPGGTITYTLTFSNAGNQDSTGVTLTETVPANTTFTGAVWTCLPNNNAGSVCTRGGAGLSGGGGSSVSTPFVVTVDSPLPAGVTQISNTATIADNGDNGADPTPANNTSSDTTPVTAAPDLVITKSDGGATAIPGGTINYTLTFTNSGNQDATGVTLTETVPANTSFTGVGWNCLPNNAAGSVCTQSASSLAAGSSDTATFAVTVINPVPAGVTQISNTASIGDDGANGVDSNPANNDDTDTTPLNAAPDLEITKSDGGAATTPGGVINYTLNYTNSGNQNATGVVLTETVPANTTFSGAGWTCTPDNTAGSVCTQTVGALAGGGGSGSATFAVTVDDPVPGGVTQISNTASLGDDGTNGADPTPGNNSDSDTTPVNAAPDLELVKSDGGVNTAPGNTVAYTLAYSNTGNRGATGVTLTDTVPANTVFNPGASSGGWSCAPDNNAGSLCTLSAGSLAAGGSSSATFAVTVINPVPAGVDQISNTATIDDDGANGAEPTPANNSDSDTTGVDAGPDLELTKSDGGVTATPGGLISYTLTYTNSGTQGAAGVVLTDTVPANTVFNTGASSVGWSCTPNNNAGSLCTLNLNTLAGGGATASRIFAVTVDNPVPAGVTQISNTASIGDDGANGTEPTPANNSDSDTTPLTAAPDLQLAKSDGGLIAEPGDSVTYTLSYTNTGNQAATGLVLTETVPTDSVFNLAASSAGWSCADGSPAGTVCTLAVPDLAGGGASSSRAFAVTVDDPFPVGVSQISNSASIADDGANGADPTPGDNTTSDTTPVNAGPDLVITKSDGGATTTPGGSVAYTLTFSNTGNQAATGATLTDTVPTGTTFNPGASSSGWACLPNNNAGSACTLSLGNLAVGANGTRTFAVTVANPVAAGLNQISNTASIGSGSVEVILANNTASDTTPLAAQPDLQLSKTDGGVTGAPGGTLTYTLRYTNTGNQGATGVALRDTVPANTTFNAAASSSGWSCPNGSPAGTSCTLAVGALAANGNGARTFTVNLNDPLPAGVSQITNTATISDDGQNGPDPTPGNNAAVRASQVTGGGGGGSATLYLPLIIKRLATGPDLVIESLSASGSGVTVVIRNQGSGPVVDAFWVDVYFNPSAPPAINQPWPTLAAHGHVWGISGAGLAALSPGGSLTLTLGDAYYFPDDSSPLPSPVGVNVFGFVDSVNFATATGAVLEIDETNNRFGPVLSSAGAAAVPFNTQTQPATAGLPARE